MAEGDRQAPGWPGIPARWTSSAKSGIGTSLNAVSRVWFTLSHGILNEIYFPRIDRACTRDCGLVVTDGQTFFSEEKRDTLSRTEPFAPGVPAYHIENTCSEGRYRIEKDVLADPRRHVVWQRIRFTPLQGTLADYRLYVILSPHLGNQGAGNSAWVGDYKGTPMLFAQRDALAMSLASSAPWRSRSVGFVGVSDGWQQLHAHRMLPETWDRADNGNVALTGEIDLEACGGEVMLVLGFDTNAQEAGQLARWSLDEGFDAVRDAYVGEWQRWIDSLAPLGRMPERRRELNHISAMVFKVHESKPLPGGLIASLSIPWGDTKGDLDLGGYHLIWPRDLVESAGGLLAVGAPHRVRDVLEFLRVTQEADGHWPQNMWLDGTPYWNGVQMDETAFPILLVDLAEREGAISADEARAHWPMMKRAAAFLVQHGPVSQQDRWEEDPGYSPFTLAVEIAALLVAADLAADCGEADVAAYLSETADAWNDSIERWIYARDTSLCRAHGVDGYYVRIGSVDGACASSPLHGFVPIKNRPPASSEAEADLIVSPDALALVRFGLRAPDDPRIVNTVKVDRCPAEGRDPERTRLASVQRRWVRRARRRPCVRRHRDRPGLAPADRRAGALRTGRRADRRGRTARPGDGGLRRRLRPAARAGLGHRGRAGARAVSGPGLGVGPSARLGARRVREDLPLARRRPDLRSAAADRAALSERARPGARADGLALQQQDPHAGARTHAAHRDPGARRRALGPGRLDGRQGHTDPRRRPRRPQRRF